ncbi:hypothetical protein [Chitinophaga sp. MM2321]|uniref:hypothetical protein n=1 Tax=Chitinophaga sp. MM2321 TaxID=3137178 RepID=UPI0032D5741D
MKKIFYLALAVILVSCNQKGKKSGFGIEEDTGNTTTPKTVTKKPAATPPIIGERVTPGAVIRNNPDGDPLVSLLDYVPVHCASLKKGWYPVSLDIDITKEEYSKPIFSKGRKIKVNGVAAGQLERDMKLSVATNGKKMWATINGYTEKKNIRTGTIVETALVNYLRQHKGRSVEDMQPFIHNFQLEEETTLKPYTLYFNYESGIDDPSPMYRLALVCQGKSLIGILHTRPLELTGSTSKKMQRNFTMQFLNGIDKSLKDDFCYKFNKFITSVD